MKIAPLYYKFILNIHALALRGLSDLMLVMIFSIFVNMWAQGRLSHIVVCSGLVQLNSSDMGLEPVCYKLVRYVRSLLEMIRSVLHDSDIGVSHQGQTHKTEIILIIHVHILGLPLTKT